MPNFLEFIIDCENSAKNKIRVFINKDGNIYIGSDGDDLHDFYLEIEKDDWSDLKNFIDNQFLIK